LGLVVLLAEHPYFNRGREAAVRPGALTPNEGGGCCHAQPLVSM
jgi:hypothetical protein